PDGAGDGLAIVEAVRTQEAEDPQQVADDLAVGVVIAHGPVPRRRFAFSLNHRRAGCALPGRRPGMRYVAAAGWLTLLQAAQQAAHLGTLALQLLGIAPQQLMAGAIAQAGLGQGPQLQHLLVEQLTLLLVQ